MAIVAALRESIHYLITIKARRSWRTPDIMYSSVGTDPINIHNNNSTRDMHIHAITVPA
jgi:hypothetical protein